MPDVGALPVPTALLLGGLLGGLLLALACRPLVARTAARRGRQARRRLLASIGEVADSELLAPVAQQRAAHEHFRSGLERASR